MAEAGVLNATMTEIEIDSSRLDKLKKKSTQEIIKRVASLKGSLSTF